MKLEMATFPVKDVRFSRETGYKDEVLEINKEELVALVLEDKKIASADLDVAFPGEQTRIVNVRDVVEPRVKVSGPGCVFPGILCSIETVGQGRTHSLPGVTVMPSARYRPTIPSGMASQNSTIVDMWGPGAEVTPFGSTINIALVLNLIDTVTELEAHSAIQQAEFKVAHRLAETTRNLTPENVEPFELFQVDPSLPRVVYIVGFMTDSFSPHSVVAYYGLPIRESLPTFIHPNELLDGAVTTDARKGTSHHARSWEWLNQPVVLGLLREHGKRLNFLGVIVQKTRFEAEHGKQVSAACVAQLARLLGADGAIITRTTASGANFIDVMLTVQACERKGVKTVLLTPEWGGKDGTDLPLVFSVPEATAIVSTGSTDREFKLPAPAKVIGAAKGEVVQLMSDPRFSPWNELATDGADITGAYDWWGIGHYTRVEY